MWWLYILYSEKIDKYYIGASQDVDTRLRFHNNPIEARKFTARGIPWILKLTVSFHVKAQCLRAERLVKRMKSRKYIEALIGNPARVQELIKKST